MTIQRSEASDKRLAASQRNKRYYERTKATQDQLVMRLHKGESNILDAAAAAAGLTRTAFFQLYLVPIAAALTSERLQELNRLVALRKLSITTVIGGLIDGRFSQFEQNFEPEMPQAQQEVGEAFDSLFGAATARSPPGKGSP